MNFTRQIISVYKNLIFNPSKLKKQLILVIVIKLFIMFAILKIFFFPDLLKKNFKNDKARSEHVIKKLIIDN